MEYRMLNLVSSLYIFYSAVILFNLIGNPYNYQIGLVALAPAFGFIILTEFLRIKRVP